MALVFLFFVQTMPQAAYAPDVSLAPEGPPVAHNFILRRTKPRDRLATAGEANHVEIESICFKVPAVAAWVGSVNCA